MSVCCVLGYLVLLRHDLVSVVAKYMASQKPLNRYLSRMGPSPYAPMTETLTPLLILELPYLCYFPPYRAPAKAWFFPLILPLSKHAQSYPLPSFLQPPPTTSFRNTFCYTLPEELGSFPRTADRATI